MRNILTGLVSLLLLLVLPGCGKTGPSHNDEAHHGSGGHGEAAVEEVQKGPHGGRLLLDGAIALELAIFETGVPPEFRAWLTDNGEPVVPEKVNLDITLTRLGGIKDKIKFTPEADFLRGDTVIYEPHSFMVTIEARYKGATLRWEYDNFEGRTRIATEIAAAFGLGTEMAGPATIREMVTVYGHITPNPEHVRQIRARFDGPAKSVSVSVGDRVAQGQTLATVESNESLTPYTVTAPIAGVITARDVNPGEQTAGRTLFTVMDTSSVWVDLAVFPQARRRVAVNAPVRVMAAGGEAEQQGVVTRIDNVVQANQSVSVSVVLPNPEGLWVPGTYVTADIQVDEYAVPLAVKRSGLQGFRDFTVVYAQIGDEYEVRMLELGRQDDELVEVLGGLEAGTRYVTTNSYILKADIEKSGASHDH